MHFYALAWKKYAQFNGRSTLGEYWWFTLFHAIIQILLFILILVPVAANMVGVAFIPYIIYRLASLIPAYAVTIRRLHDVDLSGWLCLC